MVSSSQKRGISIRMYLADGTADGLRLIEKSNWNGLAVMCARAQYPVVRTREEFSRPGVYVLISPSPDLAGRQSLYIGQADIARERLDSHLRTRDAWTHLILFVSRDTTLNKAHVQYLESRLIDMAQAGRRVDLENGNAPRTPFLSEADRSDADAFLDDMLLIYPILGVSAFEPHMALKPPIAASRLRLASNEASATGEDAAEGFTVFAGAIARVQERPSLHPYLHALRQELVETGVLVSGPTGLQLTIDYRFSSPSTAAGVLIGGNTNGRTAWKDAQGRTLKELQEAALAQAETTY